MFTNRKTKKIIGNTLNSIADTSCSICDHFFNANDQKKKNQKGYKKALAELQKERANKRAHEEAERKTISDENHERILRIANGCYFN